MSEKEKRELFGIQEETISNKRINMDGGRFENVTFSNCTLVYNGGVFPEIVDCKLDECDWELGEAAHRTVLYLKLLVRAGDGATIAKHLGIAAEHVSGGEEDVGGN